MVRAPPPVGREEGSDVQARTQASLSQEERRQPRQAAQRLSHRREEPRSAERVGARLVCASGRGLAFGGDPLDADLRAVLLEGDGGQLDLDPLAQRGRGYVAAAATADERLELLLDAELAQAGGAVLEVLGDDGSTRVVGLVVEEL